MKQTAVDFLVNEFKQKLMGNNLPEWVEKIIEQAKAMEKEHIIKAYSEGQNTPYEYSEDNEINWYDGEQYYNETFKSE